MLTPLTFVPEKLAAPLPAPVRMALSSFAPVRLAPLRSAPPVPAPFAPPSPAPSPATRGVQLWNRLEGLEMDYEVETTSSPSGVTHVTFTRAR